MSDYLGVPYKDRGRTASGFDCYGLVMRVFADHGVNLPDYGVSCEETPRIVETVRTAKPLWKRLAKPESPCLVAMRSDEDPSMVNHVGVHLKGQIYHVLKKTGVMCFKPSHPLFRQRITGYYRWIG